MISVTGVAAGDCRELKGAEGSGDNLEEKL